MEDKTWPFLRVTWAPPHKADTRSGWITLTYEIRVKLEEEKEWEVWEECAEEWCGGFYVVYSVSNIFIDCVCTFIMQVHLAGYQKMFNVFSLRSGGTYVVQVRCKPDHGFWSEWSSPSHIKVPDCKTHTAYSISFLFYLIGIDLPGN